MCDAAAASGEGAASSSFRRREAFDMLTNLVRLRQAGATTAKTLLPRIAAVVTEAMQEAVDATST